MASLQGLPRPPKSADRDKWRQRVYRSQKNRVRFAARLVQPQVLRCATAGNYQRVEVFGPSRSEIAVDREAMARFFGVRLMSFEIMDGRHHIIARFFIGTNGHAIVP